MNLIEQPFQLDFLGGSHLTQTKMNVSDRSVLDILNALSSQVKTLRETSTSFAIVTFLPKQSPMTGLLGALDWSLGAPISKLLERNFIGHHGRDETLHNDDPLLFPFKLNPSDNQYVRLLVFTDPPLDKARTILKNLVISDAILSAENVNAASGTPRTTSQIQKLINIKCHWLEDSLSKGTNA